MLKFIRKLLTWMVGGALAGVLGASWVGPRVLGWYNTPIDAAALCNCQTTTLQTAERLLSIQLYGCCAGAIAGLLLGGLVAFAFRKSTPAPAV